MKLNYSNLIFLLVTILLNLIVTLSEVTVLKTVQVIYDKSPKLRIKGAGFDANDHDINLELGATGQSYLVTDKDFMVTKDNDGDGIILKLLGNRRWANLADRTPPVALVLSGVYFANDPKKNLLAEPVIVAQVIGTPSVDESDLVLYQTVSNELRINGTGFIGAKKVDLYFQPPLIKEVAYEDVTPYPITKDEVVLRLRHGYSWRENPGALYVIGVDTGGGPVKVDGDNGAQVAVVRENLDQHDITVETTLDEQLIYADEPNLFIKGDGFNEIGNGLRWANGLLGNNVNYTTVATTEKSIQLRLVPGSYWRKNWENLPGALTLLAVNGGQGFVAVGPINSGKGRDIAMVFERPVVFSAMTKIFRTHSHELHIKGKGFPLLQTGYVPKLKFDPPLQNGVDYTVRVLDRTELELTLLDGRAWRSEAGPLLVKSINTGAGPVEMPGEGIHVADVQEDIDASLTGGIEVFPMGVKVYQSALRQDIVITGTGFKEGMQFSLDPPLQLHQDYTMEVQSKNKAVLRLIGNRKWRSEPGFIIARSVTKDGRSFPLAGNEGIRIAIVLGDPHISPSKENYHETQSKLLVISGSGFTNVADTKLVIRPTMPSAYKVIGVLEDAIRVQLKPENDWLPSFMSLKDEDENKKIMLQVAGIDTGAGEITFDTPITIGNIIKDREGVVCDDSCEFAFDGVCDDGSEPNDEYYYQNYFNYMDDDFGGFYGEEEYYGYGYGDGIMYGVAYDDYYMENEDYMVSACVEGTDCTDCGGVDAIIDYSRPLDIDSGFESCTNTCIYPRDGVCDDPRGTKYCELGTDCQDCGPVGADNFTRSDDDGWWDDDDDYWTFNDGNFLDQTIGLEGNRDKVKVFKKDDSAGPAAMFLVVLEGMVYTVGAIFAAAALYLLNRWYKGQSVPFLNVFNPEHVSQEYEMSRPAAHRVPITPDEFRT